MYKWSELESEILYSWNDYQFWESAFDDSPKSIESAPLNPTNDFREGFKAGMEYQLRESQKK